MEAAFPEALVTGHEPLIERMRNDPKDRHVLAAAVRANADAIVTCNGRDFPRACLDPYGIEKISPERFLLHQWDLDSGSVTEKLLQQAIDTRRSVESLLELLHKMVPRFADAVRPALTKGRM
jgi:hypothetical protein